MVATQDQSFGRTLPDQVDRIVEYVDAHLEAISDVRELYTARVSLEREYASKLQLLTRKANDKKVRTASAFVIGKEPTKAWDSNVIKQGTLDGAYDELIASFTAAAQDHIDHAESMTSQVIEKLRTLERRNDDAKKKEVAFFQKLLSDRDRAYYDRSKCKQKYDEDCSEVEAFRQRQGRANDDRHAERAAKQAEQQRNDMLNSKNSYLISVAIANQVKAKFYDEDLPQLENELQGLQRRLTERFVQILIHSQQLELTFLDVLKSRAVNVDGKLNHVDAVKDQNLFIDYNIRPFTAPEDWGFEPSSIHYDTDAISVDPAPKIVIQNKLRRSQEKLTELIPLMESKRAESIKLSSELTSYKPDHSVGAVDDLTDKYLDAEHQVVFYSTSERILNTEIETILNAIGDDHGAAKPHSFKSSSFSIPTQCGYCQSTIWGLSKQGKTCKACGLSVHSKCELKVPADCESSEGRPSSMLFRKSTTSSRSGPPGVAPTASSFVQSISPDESAEEYLTAKVLFDFTATSEFELDVIDGTIVQIIEPDDGSGWVKVMDSHGDRGLIPATYVEVQHNASHSVQKTGNERVRVIYPYQSQSGDELSLREGDVLELSTGPTGGKHYGDGWWEGFNSQGQKGIFPSNYVEPV